MSPTLASVARTVPVTAPVSVFAGLNATLAITGAEFAATNLAAAALGVAGCPVDTGIAGATAIFDAPSSRRTAARTIQDIGDCAGMPVPEPSSGDGNDAAAAGAATMAAGAADTGAAMTRAAERALVAVCDATLAGC